MRSQIQIERSWALRWGLIALGLVVLAGTNAPPALGATLRWKFKPGETLRYTMDQKTLTVAKLPGAEVKTTLTQTLEMTWVVKSVDESGRAELTQTINRIRDQIEAPVGAYTFDSKDPKEPTGLIAQARVPLFKALIDAPITFKMSPQGEPGDVHVPEKVAQTIRDLGPSAAGAGALFTEDGLKEMITQASLIVPQDDLSEGKTWSRQLKNNVPPLGTVVIESTYRYDGRVPEAGPDTFKIAMATKVEIQPPTGADANANLTSNGLKIRSQKSSGTFTFDNAAGHILGSNLSESLEVGATLKMGQGAAAKEMEVTQSTETTTIRKLVK